MGEIFQIYLAGGCLNEEDGGSEWRQKAEEIFKHSQDNTDYKLKIFNPTKFFSYDEADHQSDSQVKKFYMDQILHSRLVLVNLNRSNVSCGTCQELQFASDHNIEIIGFGVSDIYNWLKVDCQVVFTSLLQAIDYINDYYL